MDLPWLGVCVCVCVCVCVVRSKQELRTTHTHTHTPNKELHMRTHLPTFYNNTLLYCILLF